MASDSARTTIGSDRNGCGLAPAWWVERVSPSDESGLVLLITRRSTRVPNAVITSPLPSCSMSARISGSTCRFQA